MPGNGSMELIHLFARAFLGPGKRAVVMGPAFGEYAVATRTVGAEVLEFRAREEDGFVPDIPGACDFIRRVRPGAVFLCNPCNPTGVYLRETDVCALREASKPGILVVDEAYADFAEEPWNSPVRAREGGMIILRSFTKTFSLFPFRLGYALGKPEILEPMRGLGASGSANAFAEAVGLAALAEKDRPRLARESAREGLKALSEGLNKAGIDTLPSEASFRLVSVPDAWRVRWNLQREGILVRDCVSFGLPSFLRVAAPPLPKVPSVVDAFSRSARPVSYTAVTR